MDIFLWIVVVVGYTVAIAMVYRTFVFALSMFNEVPFVPSVTKISHEALKLLDIKDGDRFIDIGAGNGKIVFQAYNQYSKKAEYTGMELNGALVNQSKFTKLLKFNPKNLHFLKGDAFKYNYNDYNKVYLYMTTSVTSDLLFKLEKELPKGSKVVSAVFKMGDFMKNHKVDTKEVMVGKKKYNIYIWKKD